MTAAAIFAALMITLTLSGIMEPMAGESGFVAPADAMVFEAGQGKGKIAFGSGKTVINASSTEPSIAQSTSQETPECIFAALFFGFIQRVSAALELGQELFH